MCVCVGVCWCVLVCVCECLRACSGSFAIMQVSSRSGRFTRPGQPGVLHGIPALSSRAQLLKREDFGEHLGAVRRLLPVFSRPTHNDGA